MTTPENVAAQAGPVRLNCSHSTSSGTDFKWDFIFAVNNSTAVALCYAQPGAVSGYNISVSPNGCDLIILDIAAEYAGRYICSQLVGSDSVSADVIFIGKFDFSVYNTTYASLRYQVIYYPQYIAYKPTRLHLESSIKLSKRVLWMQLRVESRVHCIACFYYLHHNKMSNQKDCRSPVP